MEACTLLLLLLAVNGHSYVLQPKVSITEIAGLERHTDPRSAWRAHTLRGAEGNAELRPAAAAIPEDTETEEEPRNEGGPRLETGDERRRSVEDERTAEERRRGEEEGGERVKERGTGKEERESELVAGVGLQEENRQDGQEKFVEEQENAGESKDHKDSTGYEEENTEVILPSPPVTLASPAPSLNDSHRSLLPAVTPPTPATTNQAMVLKAGDAEDEPVSLFEDDLTEVHRMTAGEQNAFISEASEVKVGPTAQVSISSKTGVAKRKLAKSALNELETTYTIKDVLISSVKQPKTKKTNAVVPPKENKFRAKAAANPGQPDPTPAKSKESNSIKPTPQLKTSQPTSKPAQAKATENETEPNLNLNKTSPPRPHATASAAKTLPLRPPTQSKVAKVGKAKKSNKKGKKKDKTKVKKGKKGNKTKKPSEKKLAPTELAPTDFPFFKDNYCPAECACYGRVVQCSDKGVDKVPYGIPYNARYILLMNNHIDGVQLDLLSEYLDMEFLVLSNNRLTDATVEGAFEGIHALRRLYLDRNLLESVPGDLPASLEELRLDNNLVRVMSEAVWARCPGLLVLSLSNNSLGGGGNESETTLPGGVLAPLRSLRTLNLDGNRLAAVPLGLPASIRELYLRGNRIQRFRAGAFDGGAAELLVLDLSANRLTNRGLVRESLLDATRLESLNLEGNRLRQVPRHLPPSIKTLNLEGNLISSVGQSAFLAMPNLEHLGLARNRISRVAPGAFRPLPALHQLDLCHNALRQVPRQLPRALYSAALTHNRIRSVPRDAFCWGGQAGAGAAPPGPSGLVRVQLEHNLIDLGNIDTQAFSCLRGFQVVHFY